MDFREERLRKCRLSSLPLADRYLFTGTTGRINWRIPDIDSLFSTSWQYRSLNKLLPRPAIACQWCFRTPPCFIGENPLKSLTEIWSNRNLNSRRRINALHYLAPCPSETPLTGVSRGRFKLYRYKCIIDIIILTKWSEFACARLKLSIHDI